MVVQCHFLFWYCYNKKGDDKVAVAFFVAASILKKIYNVEGDDKKTIVAFCFGLIVAKIFFLLE
jgi:hypothetical protein